MRSICVNFELDLSPQIRPLDIFDLRGSGSCLEPASQERIGEAVQFLELYADCVRRYAGRFRGALTMSGATARALMEAGAGPVLHFLVETGCVTLCFGSRDRAALGGLSDPALGRQIGWGMREIARLAGGARGLRYFGDSHADLTEAVLDKLTEIDYAGLLLRTDSDCLVVDETRGLLGIPVATSLSDRLARLFAGDGIPGAVTQEIRSVADRQMVVLAVTLRDPARAVQMFPQWLFALFSDPATRTLNLDEAVLRMPRRAGTMPLRAGGAQSSLTAAAYAQLLAVGECLPADDGQIRDLPEPAEDWHRLASRSCLDGIDAGTPNDNFRRVSGSERHDRYVRYALAVAAVELQLRSL